jgi:putative DNA primase/helicase
VAVATGPPSQLLILDVDGEDGVAALAGLERAHGQLPRTVSSVTPRGGRHYWFRYPDGPAVPCSAGKVGRGLDIRGVGGYAILPPSKGPNGNRYTWHEPLGAAPIASAPDWLVELARADVRRSNGAAPPAGGAIPEGRRNDTLFRLACAMRRQGASEPAILAGLLERNKDCQPQPLPRREVERIAASGATYPPAATGVSALGN